MQSHRRQQTVLSYRTGGVPAFVSLVVAALLVPVLLVTGVIVGGLLLLIGAGALSVVMALLLVAVWRQKLNRKKQPDQSRTVEGDYRVIDD